MPTAISIPKSSVAQSWYWIDQTSSDLRTGLPVLPSELVLAELAVPDQRPVRTGRSSGATSAGFLLARSLVGSYKLIGLSAKHRIYTISYADSDHYTSDQFYQFELADLVRRTGLLVPKSGTGPVVELAVRASWNSSENCPVPTLLSHPW
jgi:hypothetical protein